MAFFKATTCWLASGFFYVNEPVVTMRESPSNQSKVESQAILSEPVSVEEKSGDWSRIVTPDGYAGWVLSESLTEPSELYTANLTISRLKAHLYHVKDTEYGPIRSLPLGSQLKGLDFSDARWIKVVLPDGLEGYVQKGDVETEPKLSSKQDLVLFSQNFLGLPYTWGGRSSFGYDCSGFVQMLYAKIGIDLQRNSGQQILDSRFREIEISQLEPGDLIFFGRTKENIGHVGLYIGNQEFIHATPRENKPWIRISHLSDFEWSGNSNTYYAYRTARQLIKN